MAEIRSKTCEQGKERRDNWIVARQEGVFRAVLGGGLSASAYERMVGELVPTHSGELSRRHTHILSLIHIS